MTAPQAWQEIMKHIKRGDPDVNSLAETVIMSMAEVKSNAQWICGDCLVRTEFNTANREHWMKLLNVKQEAIDSYYHTARRFPAEDDGGSRWLLIEQYPTLKFSHFKELAPVVDSLGFDVALDLLQHAGEENWTRKELVYHISRAKGLPERKHKQKVTSGVLVAEMLLGPVYSVKPKIPLSPGMYHIDIYEV